MQCDELGQVIEQNGFSQLPDAARSHVASCRSCAALVEDIQAIVAAACEIPAEVEPPARIWVSLRSQLEAEGILRGQAAADTAERIRWWELGRLVRFRMLATAVVAVLVVAAGVFQYLRPRVDPSPFASPEPFADTASTLDQEEQSLGPMQPASMATLSPVDNSLRENLTTVNAFIEECHQRLKEDPNDPMARDYLSAAYQQKAEILAAMMERGRSVN
jgi:hypothetical protein